MHCILTRNKSKTHAVHITSLKIQASKTSLRRTIEKKNNEQKFEKLKTRQKNNHRKRSKYQ